MSKDTSAGTPVQGSTGMNRDEIVAFFERRQRAYDDLNSETLAADYAPDSVIESPMGGTHQGRDAARAFFDAFFAAFVDLTVDSDRLIFDGTTVVQILRIEGTHTGPFHGLPPTHKPFHFTAAVVYEFKNQQILREQRIYDFTGVLVQIGVLKAKPQK